MAEAAKVLLYFMAGSLLLMILGSGLTWWLESTRRLNRNLTRALGKPADALIFDTSGEAAAGIDFDQGDLAVMWQSGRMGLVFGFDEIEGAELIVDERVVARAQKGENRRVLEETHTGAHTVVLRLLFNDIERPEFELSLFGMPATHAHAPKNPSEAVRLGRRWLSHIDAVIKRHPQTVDPYKPTNLAKPAPLKPQTPAQIWPQDEPALDENTTVLS